MSNFKPPIIFVIDDNPANLKVLTQTLASFGYKTLVAMDGLSGIQKITKALPDLILLDILMPDVDGFETCQRLKQSEVTRDIPIIFMTALASTADKVKGLSLGAVDYITKPFQGEELIARLELHLKLHHLSQELVTQNQQLQAEIAQRKQAEKRLKILSRVSEQSPASIIITNIKGEIEYVNPKFEQLTGYNLEDVIGQNPRILKSGETSEQEYQHLWEKITSGQAWHGEFHNRKRNGELYWEQASISPIKDDQDEVTHFVAVKEDITLRKQAEQDLHLLNQELEERVEKRTADLQQSQLQVEKELTERKQIEIQLQKKNEQLALTNLELARATRLKDEFLANMSHELRTPLNAILGQSEALLEGILGELNERQRQAITTVESSGQHLLSLITDILDLAKIESGKLELNINNVEIENLCKDSLVFVRQLALKKNIKLIFNLADRLKQTPFAYIQVDELRIRQALINLLTNAVKFTHEGGTVTLEVQMIEINREEEQIELYLDFLVSDTGIGIAQADFGKIFQSFVQIDSFLNRRYAGTGLGLSLVKKIADIHKGSVDFESEVGKGSVFRLRLPYQSELTSDLQSGLQKNRVPPLSKVLEVSDNEEQDRPYKVLIAEDNKANVETIRGYLEGRGYQVFLASNGSVAIDMTIAQKPDIILMDIQMPEMDGLTAIQLIRVNPEVKHIPIIALTAFAMPGDREKCLEAGANEYLSKPVRLKELFQIIQNIISKKNYSI